MLIMPQSSGHCRTLRDVAQPVRVTRWPCWREVEDAMHAGRAMGLDFFKRWHERNVEACLLPVEQELEGLQQGDFTGVQ